VSELLLYVIELFPSGPNFRAEANGGLLAVTDNGRFHQGGIIKDLVLLDELIFHILHVCDLRRFSVPVDQIVDPANGTENAVELLAGHAISDQINRLKLNAALLEPALCLLGIKTLAFAEYLNVQ